MRDVALPSRLLAQSICWLLVVGCAAEVSKRILTCYTDPRLQPAGTIDANLCTHLLIIGETNLYENGSIHLPDVHLVQDYGRLKRENPQLKVMITLLPQNPIMSQVVLNDELMDEMAESVAAYLLDNHLDGLDLDWEFPAWSRDARKTDRVALTSLLAKISKKFKEVQPALQLFVTVAAPFTIVDKAYDVEALNRFADYIQIMNYDFHFFTKAFPFTGLNAPLQRLPAEPPFLRALNSDYSTRYWLERGLNASKAVFGIPTYGYGYRLLFARVHSLYAPAVGPSSFGSALAYSQICGILRRRGAVISWSAAAMSPYFQLDRDWISYENERSVRAKTRFAVDVLRMAGVMVFATHHDDFEARCGRGTYPLINEIRSALRFSSRIF